MSMLQFNQAGQPGATSQTPPNQGTTRGNPPEAKQGGGQEPERGAGQFATIEEIAHLLEENNAKLERRLQSTNDRLEARINKKVVDMKQAGITITTEQAKQLVSVEDEGVQPQPATSMQSKPTSNAPDAHPDANGSQHADPIIDQARQWMVEDKIDLEAIDPVTEEAYRTMALSGTRITEDDPEAALINPTASTPQEFQASVMQAILTKKQRLENMGNPSRMPSMTGGNRTGNAISSNFDIHDLYRQAAEKMK